MFGAFNKKELNRIQKDISQLILLDIDPKICEIFLELMGKYSLSHKLSLPDGFIAATSLAYQIELFTFNFKDYRFIDKLKLHKPSD